MIQRVIIHIVFPRFVSTSVIGGKCSSVWDCGDLVATWLSRTLCNKDTGLRLVYHHSTVSMRTHSPKVTLGVSVIFNKITVVLGTVWRHHEINGLASPE